MAYTIQFLKGGVEKRDRVLAYLQARMIKENVFRATLTPFSDNHNRPCIKIKPVRLLKPKPYCGQHFGLCPTGAKKPNSTRLEWDDWVKFHNLVNRCLNKFSANADVWTTPMEGGVRKMWIRKGFKARIKYDVDETYDDRGRHIGKWNPGTEDQFIK